MSQACKLKLDAEAGQIDVSGELTFTTVKDLFVSAPILFAPLAALEIDLAGVVHSDSAGLALLIDWMRSAKQMNKNIVFHNIPAQMLAMAHASGLDELLPLQ
jgi:phospholipid transport system transporter-binding protein